MTRKDVDNAPTRLCPGPFAIHFNSILEEQFLFFVPIFVGSQEDRQLVMILNSERNTMYK